jgi:hypothetical protein
MHEPTGQYVVMLTLVYNPDGSAWRSSETVNAAWAQIETAIRRLDKVEHPWISLALQENAWDDPDADRIDVIGGKGDYWIGVVKHGRQLRYYDATQGEELVPVWTSDQGFTTEAKYVCHDVERVLKAAKCFCETGEPEPTIRWA